MSGISRLAKYSIEVYFNGAAPKKKKSVWSKPIASLIFLRTIAFAILNINPDS
jgi:hypothetical protein